MALDDAHAGSLPCGASLDDLIAQVTEGAAPLDRAHQAACRYCQTALEAIREAWEEFQAVARAAVAIPEDLTERIVARIQALVRSGGAGMVIDAELGETRVADAVLARLVRASAMSVPGVALATVRSAGEDPERPGSVRVALRLVAVLGPPIDRLAERVRERVFTDLETQAGAAVSRVDVAVEDIVAEPGEGS
ncbi:MAG TPA: hypothetical protein VKV21_12230 [Solirubrobacteraceae bacterium]|nr:hypothetical protein [Solirubrobacteraceae bacterium]